jgi:hypothetical protein
MPCHRCQSLMFPVDVLGEAGGPFINTSLHGAASRAATSWILSSPKGRGRSHRGDLQQPNPQPGPRTLMGVNGSQAPRWVSMKEGNPC